MAVTGRVLEVPSQRRAVLIDKDNIKLRPGQYLIKTPENFTVAKDRRGQEVRTRVSYNGSAYGVVFQNNVAIIDDETVREIRDVMLDELDGDPDKLPPWFGGPNGSAEGLARKLQSDFGYEVTPELPKLKRMTKAQIAASSHPTDEQDSITVQRVASDQPGQDSESQTRTTRATPAAAVALPGVDDDGVEEGRAGMPAQPPEPKEKVDRRPESWKRRGRGHK
jgi:hypothetical protein